MDTSHPLVMATLIEIPLWSWIASSWFNALWILWCGTFGIGFGVVFYLVYWSFIEFLKMYPVNQIEWMLGAAGTVTLAARPTNPKSYFFEWWTPATA